MSSQNYQISTLQLAVGKEQFATIANCFLLLANFIQSVKFTSHDTRSQLNSNIQFKFRTFENLIQNIMGSNEFTKSEVFSFSGSVDYADGAIVSKTVLKKETGNISLFAFAKGEALSEHTAPFDALIDVVDGRGEIIIGGKSFFLEAGQSIIMPANIPHSVKAVEKFKMVLTMIKSA